jgi:hypothetical protein
MADTTDTMTMTTMTKTRTLLHDWLVHQNGKISAVDLDAETPILERKIITSLQVLDLILFIERLRGGSIDVRLIRRGSFSSINAIMKHFFSEQYHG